MGGMDDEHMDEIISSVLDLGSLSGLVMVTQMGKQVNPLWGEHMLRYWKQFPSLQAQWIFVHTAADPYANNNPQRRKSSSFEEACDERIKAVTETMRKVTGEPHFSAAHVFVECVFEEHEDEKDEVLMAVLAQQHNTFFTLLSSFTPVEITSLAYEKGPALLEIDRLLISALKSIAKSNMDTLRDLEETHWRYVELLERHHEDSQVVKSEINEAEFRLKEIDNDGQVEAVEHVYVPWRFFSHPRATVQLQAKHLKHRITVQDTSGYAKEYLRVEEQAAVVNPDNETATITIKLLTPHIFTRMCARIVASSSNKDVYNQEIGLVKKKKNHAEALLRMKLENLRVETANLNILVNQRNKTLLQVELSELMRDFLRAKWNCHTWKAMKPFYDRAKTQTDGTEMLRGFQDYWREFQKDLLNTKGLEAVSVTD